MFYWALAVHAGATPRWVIASLSRQDARAHLFLYPCHRLFHSVAQANGGFPAEQLANEGVIAVAAVDALGSAQIVIPLQLHARNLFGDVHKLVDGDQLAGTDVDGFQNVAFKEIDDALYAVVDVHEAAGLLSIAPDFDLVFAGMFSLQHLAADGGRRFFASAHPCAEGAIDVMEARNAGLEAKILTEVAAHALGEELFPSVAVLWHGGVCVFFL